MSTKEIDRLNILKLVQQKNLKQVEAAEILGISERQIRNLLLKIKNEGNKGIISKKRGIPGNHKKPLKIKEKALALVREKYQEFGPKFASEKLKELDNIEVSHETLRLWMINEKLWIPKHSKVNTHPPRMRRACFGELIQVDGSHHRWFGEDGPMVTLIVFIDDATGKITSLHFCEQETLNDYFIALEYHLRNHGIPRGIYSDRLKVFNGEKNLTHFQIALQVLNIKSILAHSAQAKGRVERCNRTLQDRLLKELMLRGIKTIEDANKFAAEYMKMHNEKFSKEAANPTNAHRPLGKDHDLERILTRSENRILTKDFTFQFHSKSYIINKIPSIRRAIGRKIEVREMKDGRVRVFLDGIELKCKLLSDYQIEEGGEMMRRIKLLNKEREYETTKTVAA